MDAPPAARAAKPYPMRSSMGARDRRVAHEAVRSAASARTTLCQPRAGLWRGLIDSIPFQPGRPDLRPRDRGGRELKGLTLGESIGQSAIVYAGASQMLTLQIWQQDWTLGALLAAMGVTAAINARFLLMSATFRPWIEGSTDGSFTSACCS